MTLRSSSLRCFSLCLLLLLAGTALLPAQRHQPAAIGAPGAGAAARAAGAGGAVGAPALANATGAFHAETLTLPGGTQLERVVIAGPPTPPPGFVNSAVVPDPKRGAVTLAVPAYDWCFGCSATSAAMIAAYYDRASSPNSYPDMYTGPTNGGIMPMDNSCWPTWLDSANDTRAQCPLAATHDGLDGRAIKGHVDDYWISYGQGGPDPFVGNWTEHTLGDCTSDFMKTNRDEFGNSDGSTTFYNFTNGAKLTAAQMESYGIEDEDGGYGFMLFYESRGYTIDTMYNQYILGYASQTLGFSHDQYKAEIDAGRPVMIHVKGHTMVGVGYDTSSDSIYINNTWDYNTHTMTWGGSYSGMDHYAVTIVQLDPNPTLVDLISFEATSLARSVLIAWETGSEIENAGFHVWRSETEDGGYARITPQIVPSRGGPAWGATYNLVDTAVIPGRRYWYKLEDIDFGARSTWHEPVSVRVSVGCVSGSR